MLVGGGSNLVLATPRNIPPGVGYGWQRFPREFLEEVVPRMGEQWTKGREQLGGRSMQPAPRMWQEAQCILYDAIFFDDGDAIFFHQGVTSRKRGANGKPVREYHPIDGMQVADWKKTLARISYGGRVTWPQFVDFLRAHLVAAEACTCATYCTLDVREAVCCGFL